MVRWWRGSGERPGRHYLLLILVEPVGRAGARPEPAKVIVLPGATSAEGIAAGQGTTFYAGDLFAGDIFRGDCPAGTAELFIDVPEAARPPAWR